MAGELIELLKMTDVDGSANAATATHVTWVAENVSIVQWREALVVVRNHTPVNTVWPTGSSVLFSIVGVMPSREDPIQKFRGPTLGSVSIPATEKALWPSIYVFNLGTYFGALISVSVSMITVANAGPFQARLSATLAGKA